ncbi:VIP36-like protein isoform X1 [Diaphorina citri]|uniref:VIP36-like protein isoform X1 n=1 Tax=Diaphorina citri TaxID=121845 RepID=A0A3Q0J934_DIACI|nr:VIP36-like protein isoform X1 [Diaphorina citri]
MYFHSASKMFKILFTVIALIWQVVAQEAQWNTEDFLKRHHSMVKPYLTSGLSIPYWDVHGFALASSNYVRLTADLQSRYGAIWNTVPVYMNNWEVQITLKIHGKGKELFGDGMAFWYVRDRMEGGPVFGNKDFFSGLGVIIDTYSNHNGEHNHNHPYLSAMVNNGSLHYDHDMDGTHTQLAVIIDTYSNHNGEHNHNHPYLSAMVNNGSLHYDHDMDGTHTQLAGCECKLRNLNHDTHIAIRYEDENLTGERKT